MKLRYGLVVATFAVTLLLYTAVVNAGPWSALSSGYAVTSNYQGIPVWPLPQDVTVTAGTTEHPSVNRVPQFPDVTQVRFRWMPPADSGLPEWFSPPLSDPPLDLYDGGEDYEDQDGILWDIYIAEDTQTVKAMGDWGVQAWFYDSEGNLRGQSGIEKIRATSFNAVPEIPLGTVGAATAIFLGLGFYGLLRRKKLQYVKLN